MGTVDGDRIDDSDGRAVPVSAARSSSDRLRVLLWCTHGGYVRNLVRGRHRYLLPATDPDGSPAGRPELPTGVDITTVDATLLRDDPPDVVICQRLEEIDAVQRLTAKTPGRDLPAVFLEHNIPNSGLPGSPHPLADDEGWHVVQVTGLNALLWDCGSTATTVVPHGVAVPATPYRGDVARAAFVANEPLRRRRVVGADLLPLVVQGQGADVFGIDADRLPPAFPHSDLRFAGNLGPDELHEQMARRRVYLHLCRWTSLGLSLIEAMHLGAPVVVLAATEAATLPPEVGAVSSDPAVLRQRLAKLLSDPDEAQRCGSVARQVASERFGLDPFLLRWDEVLHSVVQSRRPPATRRREN